MTEGKHHINEDPDICAAVELLQENIDLWMSGLGPREIHELEMLEGARKWHGDYRKMYFKFFLLSLLSFPFLLFQSFPILSLFLNGSFSSIWPRKLKSSFKIATHFFICYHQSLSKQLTSIVQTQKI